MGILVERLMPGEDLQAISMQIWLDPTFMRIRFQFRLFPMDMSSGIQENDGSKGIWLNLCTNVVKKLNDVTLVGYCSSN